MEYIVIQEENANRTVLFHGSKKSDLSGLWLSNISRKNGKVNRGFVINGNWELKLTESSFIVEKKKYPLSEIIYEINFFTESKDYNYVIEKARALIKG